MAHPNQLITILMRLITPEEIGEITSKHNGGKFSSLTDLVNERIQRKIYRNFSKPFDVDEVNEMAKVLPFNKLEADSNVEENEVVTEPDIDADGLKQSLTTLAHSMSKKNNKKVEHVDNENMSSFIMIEKARLKKSQQVLKQKEIIQLYKQTSSVDVEQIKGQGEDMEESRESGVLVNKKHY